mgnify:CR=1 FL=1
MLVYTMLMGAFPFDAPDMSGLRKKVLAGRWDRPLAASREANDAVRAMLVVDPHRRCSLQDVMCSAWMRRVCPVFPANFRTEPTPTAEPDAAIVGWLAQRGCPQDRLDGLARQLHGKEKDSLTAAYELLAAQKAARAAAAPGGESGAVGAAVGPTAGMPVVPPAAAPRPASVR